MREYRKQYSDWIMPNGTLINITIKWHLESGKIIVDNAWDDKGNEYYPDNINPNRLYQDSILENEINIFSRGCVC